MSGLGLLKWIWTKLVIIWQIWKYNYQGPKMQHYETRGIKTAFLQKYNPGTKLAKSE